MNLSTIVEKQNKIMLVTTGFLLIGVLGILDFVTGYDFAFSLFYVLPIYLITWAAGKNMGLAASAASAVVWVTADLITGHPYTNVLFPVWNTLMRLAFFVIITFLELSLKSSLQREKELARRDPLTSAVNSRSFYETLQMETNRFQRSLRPFTIAYIDLDNFKSVNDQFGHSAGDQALCAVVNSVQRILRKTDTIARLGGDEFALLLPETDVDFAQAVITKIQKALIEEMQQKNWPITFSMGVLTCRAAPSTSDELVKLADELMYSVKNNGKHAVKYFTYEGFESDRPSF